MIFGFDLISDLNIEAGAPFDWTNKPTSLFCIIAGNLSNDVSTIRRALHHLSGLYQGVFYIDGATEHLDIYSRDDIHLELQNLCATFRNVIFLHNNVVVVDGVALVGINGWNKNTDTDLVDDFQLKCYRFEDIDYLEKTLEKLQLHNDVKKIVVITNCVPSHHLYFGEAEDTNEELYPVSALYKDTEHKVEKWVYGTYDKIVDTKLGSINYFNNGKFGRNPYYAKRVEVKV